MEDEIKSTKDFANMTLVLEREFKTTRDKLWFAYTDKDTFEKWWGPEGWKTTTKEFNFVPDGRIHYGMRCVDEQQKDWYGKTEWGLMHVTHIDPRRSFTYRDYFSYENGNINRDLPPATIVNEFIEVGDHTTYIARIFTDTVEQLEQIDRMGMVAGLTSQMRKLDKLLIRS